MVMDKQGEKNTMNCMNEFVLETLAQTHLLLNINANG